MQWIVYLAGWLPGVIFPMATVVYLLNLLRTKDDKGGILTWVLFGFGNLGCYIYAQKYFEPQAILGYLGTAGLDVAIVVLTLKYRNKTST